MSKKKDSLKPWLSRPAINRSVTLPLTRPLTQRLSNLNEFHPNELDPFLLFDTRDSMLGELESPTLDLDASQPDSLNVITATRSGVATYTDVNGVIQTAPADTVRVDYVDGVPMMLIEPSATNILTYSEDFTNSVWRFSNEGTTTVGNAAVAPNGTMTADAIIEDTSSSQHRIMGWNVNWQMTSGTDYTFSVFLKPNGRNEITLSGTGLSSRSFDLRGTDSQMERLADGWVRCFISGTATVTGIFAATVYMKEDTSVTYTGDGTSGVYIWGAQLETGSVATSYIPTSGSTVTRNADNLVIDGTDFTDFYNATEGTWYCEVVPKGNDGSVSYAFILEYGVDNNDRVGFYYYPSDGHQSITGFSSGLSFYNQEDYGDATNQLTRVSYSYKSGNHKSAINGTSDSDTDVGVASANQLFLGRRIHSLNNGKLIGHIKRLIYWPTHSDSL